MGLAGLISLFLSEYQVLYAESSPPRICQQRKRAQLIYSQTMEAEKKVEVEKVVEDPEKKKKKEEKVFLSCLITLKF